MRSPVPWFFALLCCACTTTPSLILQFPDAQSEAEAAELTAYALDAATDCAPILQTGRLDTWLASVTGKLPLGSGSIHLGRLARGPVVFYAEVRDASARPYLRACKAASSGGEVVLELQHVDRLPVFTQPSASLTVREGSVLTVDVAAADPDGATVTLSARTLPPFAAFDAAAKTLRFAPGPADQGSFVFQLDAAQAGGATATLEVTLTVEDAPRPLEWKRLYRGWHGRFDAAALYDPVGRRLITSGGRDVGVDLSVPELYTASTAADVLSDYRVLTFGAGAPDWSARHVIRQGTSGKFGHVMGYVRVGAVPSGQRMGFVFGGSDGSQLSSEAQLIILGASPETLTPSSLSGGANLPFLTGMAAASAADETKTWLFGGDLGLATLYNDVRVVTVPSTTILDIATVPVPLQGRPAPRTQAAMVLAQNPLRLIVIGGRNGATPPVLFADVWMLCLEAAAPVCPAASTWTRINTTGDTFPGQGSPGVFSLVAGYDAPRDRVITYGGLGVVTSRPWLFEDAFELNLADAGWQSDGGFSASFHQLPSPGGPLGLVGTAVAPDADAGRLLIYGGVTGRLIDGVAQLDLLEDVWTLGLTPGNERLTKLPATGLDPYPSRRVGATLTARGEPYLMGGQGEGVDPLDDWRIEGDGGVTRVTIPGVAPWPRAAMTTVYNPDLGEHWLFGGRMGSVLPEAALYRWTADAGFQELVLPGPDPQTLAEPRFAAATVYDAVNHRMVVFGGITVAQAGSIDTVTTLAVNAGGELVVTPLAPQGTGPGPRYGMVAGYDRAGQRMILYGGTAVVAGGEVDTREVWELSLVAGQERWRKIEATGSEPKALYLPAGVLTRENPPVLYLLGTVERPPAQTPRLVDGLWKLSLKAGAEVWTQISLPDFRPRPRVFPSIAYDDLGNRLLLGGGANDPVYRNDVWSLTLP